jgi:hypothetical protein
MGVVGDWMIRGYELLTVIVPFFVAYEAVGVANRRRGLRDGRGYALGAWAFAVYVYGVFHFTGAGTLHDILRLGLALRDDQTNLQFLSDYMIPSEYALNVLLFVPFGFLVPMLWPRADRLWAVVPAGLAFSLLIELSQLLNNRASDVDDLLMNTLGAAVGFLLFRAAFHGAARTGQAERAGRLRARCGYLKREPLLYIAVMFVGRFLLFDETGMWGMFSAV